MKIKNFEYKTTKLNTFQQFDIARKMAPVLTFLALQKDAKTLERGFATAFCGLTQDMNKPDMDSILATCLSEVTREVAPGTYAKVFVSGVLAYDDIDLQTMLKLIWHVLVENNLIDFFSDALSDSTAKPGNQTGSSGSASQKAKAG